MDIYVGNLEQEVSEDDLKQAFEAHGEVTEVKIIKDMYSGESKGFGFVTMQNKAHALTAMEELNNTELKGRMIRVSEARPRKQNKRGGRGMGRSRY